MRRDLLTSIADMQWPASVREVAFSVRNAPAVHALLVMGRQYGGGRVADYGSWMAAFDTDPECDRALCLVLEDPSGVVAIAQGWTSAFIRNLVVHPRVHRQGVGLALLNRTFHIFRQRREVHVDLKVMESNLPARRLYERAGMQYIQRHELDPR
jgi:ribosomal protein S18 acetylase RimI-like enzyme